MHSPLLDRYRQGPALLGDAVAALSREQLLAQPVAGKWSTLQVVCHVADMELVYADRIKRVLAEDRPSLLGADPDRFVTALAYHDRRLEEELAVVDATRQQICRILAAQPDSALQRVGVHSEAGPLTLADLLARVTDHLPHHVRFIQEKRRAMGVG